jgi:NAD(P)-dependent dehydrogenase (short-subunit alcohol dehydrogenase family)
VSDPLPPVVLVTGASRGLGRGVAVECAALGCSLALGYAKNQAAAEETAALCRRAARSPAQRFEALQADVSSREQRARLVTEALERLGHLDALVNNAGMAPRERADITVATEESFEEVVRTNVQGPYFLTQRVVAYWLRERPAPRLEGGFKVVFVSSTSAEMASTKRGEYCVSKAGVAMAAQLWAARLAPEGIQVVELRPGIMETDMTAAVKERYDALLASGGVPQGRWGTPADVGRAVRSVLAGDLRFSAGAVIHVDGGLHVPRL